MSQLFENRVKQMIKAGKKTAGAWAQLCSPFSAECLARGGFDWILIDMEHAGGDILTLITQCQAIAAAGTGAVPFVRVPWNDLVWIKRILDAGAYGLMIPYVNTKEEAVRALQACKYPPAGRSGDRREHPCGRIRSGHAGLPEAGERRDLRDAPGRDDPGYRQHGGDRLGPRTGCLLHRPHGSLHLHGPLREPGPPGGAGGHRQGRGQGEDLGIPLGTISGGWDQAKSLYDRGYQLITLISDSVLISKAGAETMAKFHEAFPA